MSHMKRYVVQTCFRPGVWTDILATDNRDRAVTIANFWDTRQNTRFIDLAALSPLEWAMWRFDEAIAALKS